MIKEFNPSKKIKSKIYFIFLIFKILLTVNIFMKILIKASGNLHSAAPITPKFGIRIKELTNMIEAEIKEIRV